jgi:hypothetical protein
LCQLFLLDIDELKLRIAAAIETVDSNMLERIWDELDYRLDICWVMNGADIEQLECHLNGSSCSCIAIIHNLV